MNIQNGVLPGRKPVVYAENQPQYKPLPAITYPDNPNGPVTSRWSFTEEERAAIAAGADLYLTVLTFHKELQPMTMQVFATPQEAETILCREGYIPAFEPTTSLDGYTVGVDYADGPIHSVVVQAQETPDETKSE